MKSVHVFFAGLFMLLAFNSNSYSQREEVYTPIHVKENRPVPYPYTREADVMWSKKIWRVMDLKEKMNLPYYYPLATIKNMNGDRMNLVSLILMGIKEGLTVYSAKDFKNEFTEETRKDDVDKVLGGGVDSVMVNGQLQVVPKDIRPEEVTKIMIKEEWFFDRNYSTLQVRILGLCPIRVSFKEVNGQPTDVQEQKRVCWIYYPDYRKLFASHETFNPNNNSQSISFDDMFTQRRFSSYIYQESNAYDNRPVIDYARGMDVLYESERIKNYIFDFEHDLWEY